MRSYRIFFTFFVSLIIFTIFVVILFYNIFWGRIYQEREKVVLDALRSRIDLIYTISKYDLQNIIRDDKYAPASSIYEYDKEKGEFYNIKKSFEVVEEIEEYIKENLKGVVFLEDRFGYLLPRLRDKELYTFVALESGDRLFLSVNHYEINQEGLALCPVSIDKGDLFNCDNGDLKGVFNNKLFLIKADVGSGINKGVVVVFALLILIAGVFFSYWTAGHFDMEEGRLISQISDAIESVRAGRSPLLSVSSPYPSFKNLIKEINRLIETMSAEINRYKVVYDQHFVEEEKKKALMEAHRGIFDLFTTGFSVENYQDVLKSFDFLFSNHSGGVRFKGSLKDQNTMIRLVFVMLLLLGHKRGYRLLIEADGEKVVISSENVDFEDTSFISLLNNVVVEGRKIIIK